MGNVCAHMGSSCVERSVWVRPTDYFIADRKIQQIDNGKQSPSKDANAALPLSTVQNKPPQQMKIEKDDKTKQPQKSANTETVPKPETKPRPKNQPGSIRKQVAATSNVRRAHNVKRLASAGLQAESVLKTRTGHLKEYYNLGHKLGHGQFGTTFLCVEKGTGREYACKSIAKRKLYTEEDVDDVRREVEIMHYLSGQPNVISIKGAYEDSVAIHVVMEVCEGGELFDRIVERGHYTERKAAQLAKIIIGVVQTFHSLGVIHRDLKPENFLFVNKREDSPLKAIDFGLSVLFKPGDIFTDIVGSPYYVAPEVLRNCYGPGVDIWSAGVMIYVLLTGSPPFWGETEDEIFEEVLHGDLDLSSDPWPSISESAKDLVRKMLVRDPKQRPTAHQILNHPWIQDEGVAPDKPLDSAVLSRLKQFCKMAKLKKMALRVIAQSLSEEELSALSDMFKMIDVDNSGQITFKELKEALKSFGSDLNESEIRSLMQAADVDNSGTIDYEEFIAATLHLNKIQTEDHLFAAFSFFDKDGSGYITQDEIQQSCKELGMKDIQLGEIIREVDRDNDGRIDYKEFVAMMRKGNAELSKNNSKDQSFRIGFEEAVSLSVS